MPGVTAAAGRNAGRWSETVPNDFCTGCGKPKARCTCREDGRGNPPWGDKGKKKEVAAKVAAFVVVAVIVGAMVAALVDAGMAPAQHEAPGPVGAGLCGSYRNVN